MKTEDVTAALLDQLLSGEISTSDLEALCGLLDRSAECRARLKEWAKTEWLLDQHVDWADDELLIHLKAKIDRDPSVEPARQILERILAGGSAGTAPETASEVLLPADDTSAANGNLEAVIAWARAVSFEVCQAVREPWAENVSDYFLEAEELRENGDLLNALQNRQQFLAGFASTDGQLSQAALLAICSLQLGYDLSRKELECAEVPITAYVERFGLTTGLNQAITQAALARSQPSEL